MKLWVIFSLMLKIYVVSYCESSVWMVSSLRTLVCVSLWTLYWEVRETLSWQAGCFPTITFLHSGKCLWIVNWPCKPFTDYNCNCEVHLIHLSWTVSIPLCTVHMTNFIELNRLYTTQLTVVILQLVTSATCFSLVWPSSGLQRLVSIKVHNLMFMGPCNILIVE